MRAYASVWRCLCVHVSLEYNAFTYHIYIDSCGSSTATYLDAYRTNFAAENSEASSFSKMQHFIDENKLLPPNKANNQHYNCVNTDDNENGDPMKIIRDECLRPQDSGSS
mmetsp:Transcript_14539/g.20191  ORF Transcript_14539/g.20191 Transcript_14539/m.20191 type:complete len:110 (-) Transcript_14539:1219-1548(-)